MNSIRRLSFAATLAMSAMSAHASLSFPVTPLLPTINESVTKAANGTYDYQFWLVNSASLNGPGVPPGPDGPDLTILSLAIPYFADAGLTSALKTPVGWTGSIQDNTTGLLPGAQLLVLAAPSGGLAWGASTGVFSYSSVYAPVKAPYEVQYASGNFVGDPLIPGSPGAIAAGLQPAPLTAVPEPGAGGMLVMGLGLLGLLGRRAKKLRQTGERASA